MVYKSLEDAVKAAKKNDQRAFGFLYDECWDYIYGYLLKISKDERIAEELSLKTLSKAFDNIDKFNPEINAVIWQDRETAKELAFQMDKEVERGEFRGPLHGIPMTVKESFNISGAPTTWGDPENKNNIAETDSDAVHRLRNAGAIVFGKTNVPLNLVEWQTFNEIYGTTNNPWDVTRTPGGSSGGSAAALSTGMTALEVGSDAGSSIRNPAHYCGVFGMKPTFKVVSSKGQSIYESNSESDISVVGPLARTAEDLKLAFETIEGLRSIETVSYTHLTLPTKA